MTERLRVLTWNIWAPGPDRDARLALIAEQIAGLRPDVLCLQECWTGAAAELGERTGMRVVVTAASDPSVGSANAILTRLPLDGEDACAQVVFDSWDSAGNRRGAVAARVLSPSGRRWRVWCTHLGWGGHSEGTRREQLRYLEELAGAEQSRVPSTVHVLCGDLNCTPESAAYRYLTGLDPHPDGSSTVWVDAWPTAGNGPGWTSTPENPNAQATAHEVGVLNPALLPRRRIDYVLTRGWSHGRPGSPLHAEVLRGSTGTFPSDHFGLVADLWDPPSSPPVEAI